MARPKVSFQDKLIEFILNGGLSEVTALVTLATSILKARTVKESFLIGKALKFDVEKALSGEL